MTNDQVNAKHAVLNRNVARLRERQENDRRIAAKMIRFSRELDIRNTDQLAAGTGAKYLRCIVSHDEKALIAKQWHRRLPSAEAVAADERIVVFGGQV